MKNTKMWSVFVALGLLLLSKLKWVLVAFKFLKLQTLLSMMLYLGTYALLYGWKFAAALVYLLFVHEMGHAYAAKKLKLPTSPAIFIPFVGAAIAMKEMPKNAKDEAYLAYMGPVFGFLSFLPAIPLYFYTEEPFWALFIFLGGLLNLFNLIPITPLDGGRIAAGISTKLWAAGLLMLVAFSVYTMSILGFIITAFGAYQWYSIYKRQKSLADEQRKIDALVSINEQLQKHAQAASIGNFSYFAESFQRTIDNDYVKECFELLHTIENTEQSEQQDRLIIAQFLATFDERVKKLQADYEQEAAYYKTTPKTKLKLFAIYVGLIIVLAVSAYFGNDIIMQSAEMKEIMNR